MLTRKVVWLLLISSVVFFMGPVFAQDSETALNLDDCIRIALENNSSLKISAYRVDNAKTSVTSARSRLLPSINSSFSSGKYIQGARLTRQDVPIGEDEQGNFIYQEREILQDKVTRNSHSASIRLSQNIFDFGRSFNYMKQANAGRDAYEHTMNNTRNAVVANVKQAFYELLKQHRLHGVYEEALQVSQDQLDRVQTMMDIGLASQAEVYQARVTLNTNKTTLINQVNNIELAKANLNNALGRYPTSALEIVGDDSEPIFPDYNFEQAEELALQNNENLKALDKQVRANFYSIKTARGAYLPSIAGSASYTRSNTEMNRVYSDKLDQDYSISLGVQMDLNIFNGFADKAAVQSSTIDYNIAVENLEEAKRTLLSDVKQYFLQLNAYQDIIEMNKLNIESYEENLRLQQEKRRVGSGTELEVAQAQYDLTRARTELINAEFEAKSVKSSLESLLGIIEN